MSPAKSGHGLKMNISHINGLMTLIFEWQISKGVFSLLVKDVLKYNFLPSYKMLKNVLEKVQAS